MENEKSKSPPFEGGETFARFLRERGVVANTTTPPARKLAGTPSFKRRGFWRFTNAHTQFFSSLRLGDLEQLTL